LARVAGRIVLPAPLEAVASLKGDLPRIISVRIAGRSQNQVEPEIERRRTLMNWTALGR
jgi:hypothetical protein